MMGIKITDVKVVGLCSKCRKSGDEIPRWKNGDIVQDKDIACVGCAIGKGKEFKLKKKRQSVLVDYRDLHKPFYFEEDVKEFIRRETGILRLLMLKQITFQEMMDRREKLIGKARVSKRVRNRCC